MNDKNKNEKIKSLVDSILLCFLFLVIFIVCIVSNGKSMESYIAVPISALSIIGIILLIKDTKQK